MTIIFKTKTSERAEHAVKALDSWIRHFFNSYGACRKNSGWLGGSFVIIITIEKEEWEFCKNGFLLHLNWPLETYEAMSGVIIKELEA